MLNKAIKQYHTKTGFTLVELVLVVAILAVVSSFATLHLDGLLEKGKVRRAEHDLHTLREALVGSPLMPGYLPDMEKLPGFSPAFIRVHNLLGATNVIGRGGVWLDHDRERRGYAAFGAFTNWNANLERGWRGPYVRAMAVPQNQNASSQGFFPAPGERRCEADDSFAARGFAPQVPPSMRRLPPGATPYALPGDLALADPWGNPYVLQIPPSEAFDRPNDAKRFQYARLVSAGPDGVLDTPCFNFEAPRPPRRPRRWWRSETSGARPWLNYEALDAAEKRMIRLAGRSEDGTTAARGDDLVLFIQRTDIYENDE